MINQWILRRQWWHNQFFLRRSLLVDKLVPVVAIHSLRGSRANRHHMPNPQSGAAQPTQDEDHTTHEQSTRVPFGSPPGKGQEPLTITTIGARDNHQPPLNDPRCSKPSRWRQPPRVTRKLQPSQPPSATRCNLTRKCTWIHSMSLWFAISSKQMSRRGFS